MPNHVTNRIRLYGERSEINRLSDYVPNRLGGFDTEESQKPKCPIIGADGNIYNVMGIAAKTLRKNGMREQAEEMQSRVTESGSYHKALGIIMEYVEPVSEDEIEEESEDMDQGY